MVPAVHINYMNATPLIFDRQLLRQRRNRAASHFANACFIKAALAGLVVEHVLDVNRRFGLTLDLGAHTGWPQPLPVGEVVSTDISSPMLDKASGLKVVADEEFLPFAAGSFDLVVSAGSLHTVNDLPGTLIQIRTVLKPDGFFVASFIGGNTLDELRQTLLAADIAITGGASPRISPMISVSAGNALMQRAGFAMPAAEVDRLDMRYHNPMHLLADLRAMGETSVMVERPRTPLRRTVLADAMARYTEQHSDADGLLKVTVEAITLSGWAPVAPVC